MDAAVLWAAWMQVCTSGKEKKVSSAHHPDLNKYCLSTLDIYLKQQFGWHDKSGLDFLMISILETPISIFLRKDNRDWTSGSQLHLKMRFCFISVISTCGASMFLAMWTSNYFSFLIYSQTKSCCRGSEPLFQHHGLNTYRDNAGLPNGSSSVRNCPMGWSQTVINRCWVL